MTPSRYRGTEIVQIGRRKWQLDLSVLLTLPFLVCPFFIGASLTRDLTASITIVVDWFSLLLRCLIALILYVIAFCLTATRRFDRRSDFRKFPFRGSMLIGGVAGTSFMAQLVFGFYCAIVLDDPSKVLQPMELFDLVGTLLGALVQGTTMGAFAGAWFGLAAGSVYCIARKIKEWRTGKSTIRPGQEIKRLPFAKP